MPNPTPIKAIVYVCAAFLSFTTMSMLNKTLTGLHHPVEIMFYRNAFALVLAMLFILATQSFHYFRVKHPALIAMRIVFGTVSLTLTLAATQALPMSTATVLFFVSTLITPILAIVFLKETVGWRRWGAIAVGFAGVLIVAQPSPQVTMIGVIMALLAGFGHSIVHIMLRFLRGEDAFTVTLYFFIGGSLLAGLAMPWVASMPSYDSALALLGIGITGGLGQFLLTRGFALGEASVLSPFNYTGLLWSVLFDVTIFGLVPTRATLMGAALIIGANLYIAYRARLSIYR